MINPPTPFFAAFSTQELLEAKRQAKPARWTNEVVIVCGIVGVLTILLVAWAWLSRRKERRRRELSNFGRVLRRPSERDAQRSDSGASSGDEGDGNSRPRRRRRRRRRGHRPRNPTLAETGGLP